MMMMMMMKAYNLLIAALADDTAIWWVVSGISLVHSEVAYQHRYRNVAIILTIVH